MTILDTLQERDRQRRLDARRERFDLFAVLCVTLLGAAVLWLVWVATGDGL